MPRVKRERAKYHTTTPAATAKPATAAGAAVGPALAFGRPSGAAAAGSSAATASSQSLFAGFGALTKPAADGDADIVSAPVSIYPASDSAPKGSGGNDEEETPAGRVTKKGKRVERHKKWMEKISAAQTMQKKQKTRRGRETNKSALIRGMGAIQDSLRDIQADQMAKDLLFPSAKTRSQGAAQSATPTADRGLKTRKAKNKAAVNEEKRFNQILGHPAFQANPLATIRQHLANTLPSPSNTNKTQ
ncbi:hypothetical protein GQ54DRAFT_325357 [Martensiomyces pterosporus]|nr:hypothetical protein GQ54DRAFT_325357 [Martensiomyces pterosporus]